MIKALLIDAPRLQAAPTHIGGLCSEHPEFWERWRGKEVWIEYHGPSSCKSDNFTVVGPPALIEDLEATFDTSYTSVCRHILQIGD